MTDYAYGVSKLTDAVLGHEIAKCAAKWWEYGDPATDAFWWYRALLREQKQRQNSPNVDLAALKTTVRCALSDYALGPLNGIKTSRKR